MQQEDLCVGICSIATLSRIERGEHVPSPGICKALLSVLGISAHEYNFFASDSEFKRMTIEKEIKTLVARENYNIKELLALYKDCSKTKMNEIERQFYLFFSGLEEQRNRKVFSDKALMLFIQAIKQTVKDFTLDGVISRKVFFVDELMILNNIALEEYQIPERVESAFKRLYFLKDYFENSVVDSDEKAKQYPVILLNLACWEEDRKNYEKEVELAGTGIQSCRKDSGLSSLAELIVCKGTALAYLGKYDEAKKYIHNALVMKLCMAKEVDYYIKTFKELFGYDFEYVLQNKIF